MSRSILVLTAAFVLLGLFVTPLGLLLAADCAIIGGVAGILW